MIAAKRITWLSLSRGSQLLAMIEGLLVSPFEITVGDGAYSVVSFLPLPLQPSSFDDLDEAKEWCQRRLDEFVMSVVSPEYSTTLPTHMHGILRRYADHHVSVGEGSFLYAVLCNDLVEAARRADSENTHLLPAYAAFLRNEMPSSCWGSERKVDLWVRAGRVAQEMAEQMDKEKP